MKARRAFAPAVVSASAAIAVFAACSFPEVTFAPGAEGGNAVPIDAAALTPDGQVSEGDSGGKVDPQGCDPLDCDGDGDKNKNFDAGPDGAPPDCDDLDTRARHSQTKFLEDMPVQPSNGDWNCDKRVVKFHPVNVACSGFVSGDTCNLVKGFTGDPGCGQTGDFIYCKKDTLLGTSCVQDRIEKNIKQACQ